MILAAGASSSPMLALLALVLGSVVCLSLVLVKFRQSLLVGYFLSGVILANSGVSTLFGNDVEGLSRAIDTLSELGIVLLMFTLGIEFSIRELIHLRRVVLGGGAAQMTLCTLAGLALLIPFGISGNLLLVVAFALALSSTAVSIKSFQDMGLPNTPGARFGLGVAIFQDLAVIIFMVLLPSLLGNGSGGPLPLLGALAKGCLFLVVCWFLSRNAIPRLLHAAALTRSRELFTITVVALCALIAWGANWIGLSLALGAFAAGLVVSESIYSHRVLADILPFKDLFLTIFFVSVGLMIDIQTLSTYWAQILLGVLLILSVKGLLIFLIARRLGLRLQQALLACAALASSGEFSLVLLSQASSLGGLPPAIEQILLACTAVSMGLVPTLMRGSLPLTKKLTARGFFKGGETTNCLKMASEVDSLKNHVVICGYGPVGQALHEAMDRAGIPVIILEMNAETVRKLHHEGTRVLFADATKVETMELAKIATARSIAFTFPDAALATEGIRAARQLNPEIITFARAKFMAGVEKLKKEGVSHILHDEATSGHAMIEAVMSCYTSARQAEKSA
ncbi:MAG: cation:proton antiporter [Verrucomicrobiales bacterium]